jgi:DNA-binding NarL/FixJ family response regulator
METLVTSIEAVDLQKLSSAISFESMLYEPAARPDDQTLSHFAPACKHFEQNICTSSKHQLAPKDATGAYTDSAPGMLRVGLIDSFRFSQDSLINALESVEPKPFISAFVTIEECVAAAPASLDLLLFFAHASECSDLVLAGHISSCHTAMGNIPVMIMSDVEDGQQDAVMRCAFENGARGFVPARTSGIPLILAIMAFIKAGGTYAPAELLVGKAQQLPQSTPVDNGRFTSRQKLVLTLLRQGKANKIIAHELGMSESTVKVHVRSIIRAMGATNRTQAAYKASQMPVHL